MTSPLFSHLTLGVRDFTRAYGFYAPLMTALGHGQVFYEAEAQWAGWGPVGAEHPVLVICRPFDGRPAHYGNGQMTAFLAEDRATVDRVYALARAQGGLCEGPPGLRPHYHAHYYGAYFRDLDHNKLCVCCHRPAA